MSIITGSTVGGPFQGLPTTPVAIPGTGVSVGANSGLGNTGVGVGSGSLGGTLDIGGFDVDVSIGGDVTIKFDQRGDVFDADVTGGGTISVDLGGGLEANVSVSIDGDTVTVDVNGTTSTLDINDLGDGLQEALEAAGLSPEVASAVGKGLSRGISNTISDAEQAIKDAIPNAIDDGFLEPNDRGRLKDLFQPAKDNFDNPPASPLVLDLDGDGIELTSLEGNTAFFDVDVNGFAEATGWVAPDDGLLALDVDGDGKIDDGSELFGDQTGYDHGFLALAANDSSGDGVIDASDAVFDDLLIWQDANSDGISQADELRGLADVGITSISLGATATDYEVAGNDVLWESSFTWADGSSGVVADAFFETDTLNTVAIVPDDFAFHEDVFKLPVFMGVGALASSWVALSQDDALRQQAVDLVAQASSGDIGGFIGAFREFVYDWAGVGDADQNGRGDYVDGRNIAFLESVFDQDFTMETYGADPHAALGRLFDEGVNNIINQMAMDFLSQVPASNASLNTSDDAAFQVMLAANPVHFLTTNTDTDADIASVFTALEDGTLSSDDALSLLLLLGTTTDVSQADFKLSVANFANASSASFATTLGEIFDRWNGESNIVALSDATVKVGAVFSSGAGDQLLVGSTDSDVFIYNSADGSDTIWSQGRDVDDTLIFTDLSVGDVSFSYGGAGNDELLIDTGTETLTIKDFYRDARYHAIEEMVFEDGTTLDLAGIRAKAIDDQKATGFVFGNQTSDTFEYTSTDGSYTIYSQGRYVNDTLVFTDLGVDDVSFTYGGTGFDELLINTGSDTLTIKDFYRDSRYHAIEEMVFDDGTTLDLAGIRAKAIDDQKATGFVFGNQTSDTFEYTSTDGSYTIYSQGKYVDDFLFFTDLDVDDVIFDKTGSNDADLSILFGNDTLVIKDFNRDARYHAIEEMTFADGTVLDMAGIQTKIDDDAFFL